jgi:hypothetical protein
MQKKSILLYLIKVVVPARYPFFLIEEFVLLNKSSRDCVLVTPVFVYNFFITTY